MTHASSLVGALRSVALTVPDLSAAEAFFTSTWPLPVAARAAAALYLRGATAPTTICWPCTKRPVRPKL